MVVNLGALYEIHSNRESGFGRYDLLLRPRNSGDRGIIMEFKAAETPEVMDTALDAAEKQMWERAYGAELEHVGVRLRLEIAVALCGKRVMIRGREISS